MGNRGAATRVKAVARAVPVVAALLAVGAGAGYAGSAEGRKAQSAPAPGTLPGTLGARSRRIGTTDAARGEHYFWLSGGEVLWVRKRDSSGRFELTRQETGSGADSPLTAFNEAFGKMLDCAPP